MSFVWEKSYFLTYLLLTGLTKISGKERLRFDNSTLERQKIDLLLMHARSYFLEKFGFFRNYNRNFGRKRPLGQAKVTNNKADPGVTTSVARVSMLNFGGYLRRICTNATTT